MLIENREFTNIIPFRPRVERPNPIFAPTVSPELSQKFNTERALQIAGGIFLLYIGTRIFVSGAEVLDQDILEGAVLMFGGLYIFKKGFDLIRGRADPTEKMSLGPNRPFRSNPIAA